MSEKLTPEQYRESARRVGELLDDAVARHQDEQNHNAGRAQEDPSTWSPEDRRHLLRGDDPPVIDHNPDERRQGNGIWWVVWGILVLGWAGYFAYHEFDRWSVFLGIATGGILASWAIEVTGNRLPSFMVPPPKRRVRK